MIVPSGETTTCVPSNPVCARCWGDLANSFRPRTKISARFAFARRPTASANATALAEMFLDTCRVLACVVISVSLLCTVSTSFVKGIRYVLHVNPRNANICRYRMHSANMGVLNAAAKRPETRLPGISSRRLAPCPNTRPTGFRVDGYLRNRSRQRRDGRNAGSRRRPSAGQPSQLFLHFLIARVGVDRGRQRTRMPRKSLR